METFTMSRKEVPRAGLVKAALAGTITNPEGARALHLSVRQFQRLKVRWRRDGLRGLVQRARGQPSRRRRRAPQHRSRRLRAPAMGQLVQLDASPFARFEDRGPEAALHGAIDDATSTPLALW